jgi:hypothetical protein
LQLARRQGEVAAIFKSLLTKLASLNEGPTNYRVLRTKRSVDQIKPEIGADFPEGFGVGAALRSIDHFAELGSILAAKEQAERKHAASLRHNFPLLSRFPCDVGPLHVGC